MICHNYNSSTTHQPKICSLGGADKSGIRVGHLNTILARGGNLKEPIFKVQIPGGGCARGGGMLKFRIDRRIAILRIRGGSAPKGHLFQAGGIYERVGISRVEV